MRNSKLCPDEVITELRIYIARNFNGLQKEYAESLGVSSAFVSSVMNGKKLPTDKMLNQIGFSKEIETRFLRVSDASFTRQSRVKV